MALGFVLDVDHFAALLSGATLTAASAWFFVCCAFNLAKVSLIFVSAALLYPFGYLCESVYLGVRIFPPSQRLSKSFLSRKSIHMDASAYCSYWEIEFLAPVFQTLNSAAEFYEAILPCVSGLFGSRGPFAISWRIAFVIIYSLYAESFWTRAHVFVEVGEILPAFAESYSSATIIPIGRVARTSASLFYSAPKNVFWKC